MNTTKTFLAAVVCLGLLLFYQWDKQQLKQRETAKEESERLFTFEASDIHRVLLHNEHGDFKLVRHEKSADQISEEDAAKVFEWRILEPIETLADKDQVEPMLSNLRGVKRRESFKPDSSIKEYGLENPQQWVEVEASPNNESQTVKIFFGGPAHQTHQIYAKVEGEDEIFTMSDYAMRQCQKSLFNLRDKTIIRLPLDEITGLKVVTRDTPFKITQPSPDSKTWFIETPETQKTEADPQEIEKLLQTLRSNKATEIIDSPSSPSSYFQTDKYLARAVVQVTRAVSNSEKPELQTLFIGRLTPDFTGIYCQTEGEDRVMVARAKLLSEVQHDPNTLRDKTFFKTTPEAWVSVGFQKGEQEIAIKRVDAPAHWDFVEDQDIPISLKKVERMVSTLQFLQATQFIADNLEKADPASRVQWGLDVPECVVRVKTSDGTEEGLDIGEINADEGIVYVRRVRDSAVLALDFTRVGDLYKYLLKTQWEDRSIVRVDPETIQTFVIALKMQNASTPLTLTFTRRKASWRAEIEGGGGASHKSTIKPFEVEQFFTILTDLEYVDPFIPEPDDTSVGGLREPVIKVTLQDKDGKELLVFGYGKQVGLRQVVGMPENPFLIGPTSVDQLQGAFNKLLEQARQEAFDPNADEPI